MTSSSLAVHAPSSALVTIGSAVRDTPAPRRYAADDLLVRSLPAARRALVLGDADGALAAACAARYPETRWYGSACASATEAGFDLFVLADAWLDHADDPRAALRGLHACAAEGAQLVAALQNRANLEQLQRWLEADLSDEDGGPLHRRHLRHASPASFYKLLLDSGWLPSQAGEAAAPPTDPSFAAAAVALATSVGVPAATAQRQLGTGRLVVQAIRDAALPGEISGPARFDVVVPTTRELQLRLNVEQSPGLAEVEARIVACRGATSAADALQGALPHVGAEWILFCHQDIYFPEGFGRRLNALLASIPDQEAEQTLIGFAGMAVDAARQGYEPAGFVIDRRHRFDHAASAHAISLDELAIVVSRRSLHRIDPALGWHLWATDLCLASICTHRVFPRIVRMPLFHNSVNDYQLSPAFHRSAQHLATKYPEFGPIHTLCGVIAAAPVAAPAPGVAAANAVDAPQQLAVRLDGVVGAIDAAMQAGDCERAVRHLVAGVHQHYRLPEVAHQALYYPELDRRVGQLADRLERLGPVPKKQGAPRGQLLIATELYALGGHTRVLEDISRELVAPTLVLTDLFGTYEKDPGQLEWIGKTFAHADLVVLPPGTYWDKCMMLRRFAAALNPHTIVHFSHHQDPIPFIGTLRSGAPNQVFVHHGDHNPSLGCTIPELHHVDLTDDGRDVCAAHLAAQPASLPLYVEDQGAKVFDAGRGTNVSVASSGHPAKFARSGPLALASIVRAALNTVGGRFHHIGPLDADWVAEIRASLQSHAIRPDRFVHHGQVPSVWQCLKGLDAAFYVASAPLGGGRVAIEAQGCGYPVLYFENGAHTSMPANHSLYASGELKWTSTDDLARVLSRACANHGKLSDTARTHYGTCFSRPRFKLGLQRILGAEAAVSTDALDAVEVA